MWVYEGQTQYWDRVLCARSGLWTRDNALQAIAETAATHEIRAGSVWRPLSDTTRDPIIASRAPLPWPSWQRNEDYYTEGALIWLDVDTRIRELTGEARSLDDFARVFFAVDERVWITNTYEFDDVIRTLSDLAPFDWGTFFDEKLHRTTESAPLDGLERGGYRLVYRDRPTDYLLSKQTVFGISNFLFSSGLSVGTDGPWPRSSGTARPSAPGLPPEARSWASTGGALPANSCIVRLPAPAMTRPERP
jgi:predicted metalloprotease with PDZ domain